MDDGQTDRTTAPDNAVNTAVPRKKGQKNGSTALLRAKHLLDDTLAQLSAFPELTAAASALRENVLTTLLEHERRTGRLS